MKAELFKIYIRNHRNKVHYFALIFFLAFLFFRIYLYGIPDTTETIIGLILILSTLLLFIRQQEHYKEILSDKRVLSRKEFERLVISIGLNKAGYIIPFLIILFWPLRAEFFYEHILGFIFVFCSIAFYTAASAVFFPLMLWDIGIFLLFTAIVVALNFHTQETPYAGLLILIFGAYTISVGRKIGSSAEDLVRSKAELHNVAMAANKAQQAKSDFLAVMSHEIRTPLSGIMGMIDFLRETPLTEEQKNYLDIVTDCSRSLIKTLNDVLDVSKMEAGKYSISKVNFDLRKLIQNIVYMADSVAKEKNNSISVFIHPSVPQIIYSDPDRLRQVTNNLIGNAIKFTDAGEIRIGISYDEGNKRIKFQISDTGIGISKDDQKKLFKKFSQVDTSISRQYGGTGLGLSIAAQLVSLLGGRIGVLSDRGAGSTFWFEIPHEEATVIQKEMDVSSQVNAPRSLHVLLVDDNSLNQRIVERYLSNRGHSIRIVQSGREAIKIVQEEVFDLILMDLHMPDMDGTATATEIKKLGDYFSQIPIIALTADVMESTLKECRDVGMVDYIAKPIDRDVFLQTINRHIRQDLDSPLQRANGAPISDMNPRLKAVYEEFGPDYAAYFLRDTLAEIDSALAEIEKLLPAHNLKAVAGLAHNITSIGGNAGMERTFNLAQTLEKLCRNDERTQVFFIFQQLKASFYAESAILKSYLGEQ